MSKSEQKFEASEYSKSSNLTPQEAVKVYKKAYTPMSLLSLTWIIK